MGNATELAAARERLERVAKVITGDWTAAGNKVGLWAKGQAKAEAAAATGGSGRLRNMGRGAVLGSRYNLENEGKRMTLILRPPGPWVIFEQGAKGHEIRPKRSRLRGGGSGFGIDPAIIGAGYEHPVYRTSHPGVKQKRGAIRKTFARVREGGTRQYHEEMVKQIGQIYG